MKNGHSAFLVFLNRDHVSAYKRYHICIGRILKKFLFSDYDPYSFPTLSPRRLCTVVSALKGRGIAEVIANAR